MKPLRRRILQTWHSAALALLATCAFGPQVVAGASLGSGDTIGSHPGTSGDDQEVLETRPVFFIEGPGALVFQALQYHGPGQARGVVADTPGNLRLEFSPSMTVMVDMALLADPRVSVGFRVAPRGGATRVQWTLGEHGSRIENLPMNGVVELPVVRLRAAGILDAGLGLTAFHATSGRTSYSVSSESCALVVRPQ